jgi:hypothetical protein
MDELTILIGEPEAIAILGDKESLDLAVACGAVKALKYNPGSRQFCYIRSQCERIARRQAAALVGAE